MRRLMRIPALAAAMLPLLLPVAAEAQRSAYGVDWTCGYITGAQYIEKLRRANEEDLSCLAGAGFWDEVLPRIGGRMDQDRQRLHHFLDLMLNGSEEAYGFFEADATMGNDEAILWMLIARGEAGLEISDRRSREVAVNLFVSLPPWTRERFASRLADALLAEGDGRAGLGLGTALRIIATDDDQLAQAAMIEARVAERYGSTDNAVALYDEAGAFGNDRLSAEAELRKIALMWRTGYIKSDEAVTVLQELVTVWRGESLGAGITLALSRAYYFDQQMPQAIRLLSQVTGSGAPEDIRLEAERRIRSIADDLFVRRMDPATVGDLMDVYDIVRPLIGPRENFWLGDLKLAQDLVRAGLLGRAEILMQSAEPGSVREAGGDEALLASAEMMILFDKRADARGFLAAVPRQSLSEEDQLLFSELEAKSARVQDLHTLLDPDMRPDILAIILQRAWEEEAYGLYHAARAYSDERDSWRDPAAAYLARGERTDRLLTEQSEDARLRALSSAPKPSVYEASDLRSLLVTSAEVADLASTLTQIGQELSPGTTEASAARGSN